MDCTEIKILEQIKNILMGLTWARTVEYERIRIGVSDFEDHEIPVIQIFDTGANVRHSGNGRVEVSWQIAVELILRPQYNEGVNQKDLLNKKQEIEQAIGEYCNLPQILKGFYHFRYLNWVTDIHSIKPYYLARLTFEAVYQKPYAGCAV